jgi:hypothetical protein
VKYVEFKRLKNEDDGFILDSVTESDESFIEKLIETYWSKEKVRGKLIQSSCWRIKRDI